MATKFDVSMSVYALMLLAWVTSANYLRMIQQFGAQKSL